MEHRPGTLETIAKRLDIERKAVKNWRHFSWKLNVDSSVIEPLKWYGNFSPTIRVFEHLEVVKPDLTVLEVKNALFDIGRKDLRNHLDEAKDGDGNKACEAISSDLLDEIALGLDRSDGVVGNWSKFAERLGISREDRQQFEIRVLESPTCRLFEYLEKTKPNLTLEEVETGLRDKSVKRNNLADLLREVIYRKGNKLVREVMTPESDLLRKISNGLNRTVVGTGNWRNLAYRLNIPREDYDQFQNPEGQEKPSPTITIMKWVVGERHKITISDVVEELTSIERMDVIEEINNVVGKAVPTLEMSKLRVNLDNGDSQQSEDKEDAAVTSPAAAALPPAPAAPPPPAAALPPAPAAAGAAATAVTGGSPQVFLSYQWDLQPTVQNLKERLEEKGISCWMDKTEMGPGNSLRAEIDAGIRNCKFFISCMNKKYHETSKFCPLEATLADELGKHIIPLLLEDIKPWPPKGKLALVLTDRIYIKVTEASGGIPEQKFAELLEQVQKYI